MSYKMAAIDVHKKILAVMLSDDDEFHFEMVWQQLRTTVFAGGGMAARA